MKDNTLLCFIQRDTQKVTELSFLACLESTRDHQKKTLSTVKGRAALRLIYAASEGRFGSCCSRQSLLRRPMKGRSRACAKMGAHSVARACDGGGSYRNRSRTKKHTAARGDLRRRRRRVCLVVVFWVPSSMGASFSADNFTYNRGNCNTLKDNLILSLIRYVVVIES